MGLFSPRWKSADWQKRIEGIKELDPLSIKDQQILTEIAKNDSSIFVRQAAIQKVTDQDVLAWIVRNEKDPGRFGPDLRKTALERLTDQKLLADVLKHADNLSECKKVVESLSDQVILAEIARSAKDVHLRWAAIQKVNDRMILAGIAKKDHNYSIRRGTFKLLGLEDSQEALCDTVLNETNYSLRDEAMAKITDPDILAGLAKNAAHDSIRKAATLKITDQSILGQIAKTDKYIYVQIAASLRLSDLSQKTENLVRIFTSTFDVRSRIIDELKELYSNDLLTLNDKASILQLQGQEITRHADQSWYTDFVCGGEATGKGHEDKPVTFFSL